MTAEYMHIGVPILNKKEGVTHNEDMKFWVSNVDDYDFKMEYLKLEERTSFPKILSKQSHVTCRVDDLNHCVPRAQRIIFESADRGLGIHLTLVTWDSAIAELYEEK